MTQPRACTCLLERQIIYILNIKAHANRRNIVGQQHATLLGSTCCVRLHGNHNNVGTCCVLVWNQSNVWRNKSQLTFLLFCDRWRRPFAMLASWKRLCTLIARITVPECIASLDECQQIWQLLRSFACTTQQVPTTPNVVTFCVRLHGSLCCCKRRV